MAGAWLRQRGAAHSPRDAAEVVTGERLQSLADVALMPPDWPMPRRRSGRPSAEFVRPRHDGSLTPAGLARVDSARVLFVYGHQIDCFRRAVWPRLQSPKVLITHNSDHEIGREHAEWLEAAGGGVVRWFAQNATVGHPRLIAVPIGIANAIWPHGDLWALALAARRAASRPKDRLVYARFDPTTYPPRRAVWDALRASFPELGVGPPRPVGFRRYLSELSRHRFAVCPRGNGIDTYRVWESLHLGVIPVVERSPHSSEWVKQGLPLLLIDDWHEVTPAFLRTAADRLPPSVDWRRLPATMRMSHYASLIATARAQAEAGAAAPAGP